MLPNCGNGRSSWPRVVVALRAERGAGERRIAEERVRHLSGSARSSRAARYFGSSWLMLTAVLTVPPSGRWSPRAPT